MTSCPCPGNHSFCEDCRSQIQELHCPLCRSSRLPVAIWLLEGRKSSLGEDEALGLWHRALRHGQSGVLICLRLEDLGRRSRWNLLNAVFDNNSSSLRLAAESGHAENVSMLCLMRAEVDARDDFGETALHRTLIHNDPSGLQALLANRANPEIVDEAGAPPIVIAAASGNVNITQCLLQARVDPSAQTLEGETALMASLMESSNVHVLRMLLRSRVCLHDVDDIGETALHVAVRFNNRTGVELLLAAQADCNLESGDGVTPMQLARQLGKFALLDVLRGRPSPITSRRWRTGALTAT